MVQRSKLLSRNQVTIQSKPLTEKKQGYGMNV